MIEYLTNQFQGMDFWEVIQIVGLVLSFVYLILEFEQKALMWIVSAICSIIYASVYFNTKIYADMAFSCFNVVLCVYGYIKWLRKAQKADATARVPGGSSRNDIQDNVRNNALIEYRTFSRPLALKTFGATFALWLVITAILKYLTDSPVPGTDSFTTTLNIVGTWVLAQKLIEVWGFWFVVNLVSIYLYCKRGLHISTILLYVFYLGASVYGFWKWKRYGKHI